MFLHGRYESKLNTDGLSLKIDLSNTILAERVMRLY